MRYNGAMIRFYGAAAIIILIILVILFGDNPVEEARKRRAEKTADLAGRIIESAKERNKFGMGAGDSGASTGGSHNIVPQYNEYQNNNPYRKKQSRTGRNGPAPQEEYYPPNTNQQPKPQSYRSGPGFELKNGQPIRFVGEKVFTLDKNGKEIPLPSGNYQMYGGYYIMSVANGKKIIN